MQAKHQYQQLRLVDIEQNEAALRVMRALTEQPFKGEPHRAHKRFNPSGEQHGQGIRNL